MACKFPSLYDSNGKIFASGGLLKACFKCLVSNIIPVLKRSEYLKITSSNYSTQHLFLYSMGDRLVILLKTVLKAFVSI